MGSRRWALEAGFRLLGFGYGVARGGVGRRTQSLGCKV